MFEFLDIEQNTEEWLALRAGKLTSSKLAVVMTEPRDYVVISLGKEEFAIANMQTKALYKKRYESKQEAEIALSSMKDKDLSKSFTETAKKYAVDIAIEQITGNPISSNYSNQHMERGHEQEPMARMLYEDENFCDVSNGGFFQSDFVGCSPDGLVCEDGAVEIKSVISSIHYTNVKRGTVDPAYKWQCRGNLKFTGREWLDFVSYCADYPTGKQLFIHRLHKDDLKEEFALIDARIELFEELVSATKTIILESKYST